jgi:hypothetical protein
MQKQTNKPKKSEFISKELRELTDTEQYYKYKISSMFKEDLKICTLSLLPAFVSNDNKRRSLILNHSIIKKIERGHGKIIIDNLIINANNWDYVIKNVEGNINKINLIKLIPETTHFLTIGANRINGYFIVTHYESSPKKHSTLKNLLKNKGDSLNHIGEAALSHLQLP